MSKTIKAEHLLVDPPLITKCDKPEFQQKHFVVSIVAPNDRIKQRFMFEANRFLYHDVNKQIMDTTINITKNINYQFDAKMEAKIESYKTSKDPTYQAAAEVLERLRKELQMNEDEQVATVLREYRQDEEELTDRFEHYKMTNAKELESQFNEKYTDQTSVLGFKVRGIFEDIADAKAYAKKARDEIEPFVHSLVAPVGYWVPFDPNADAIQDQDYMVPALNNLVEEKKRNSAQKDEFFAKRKQMMIDEADKSKDDEARKQLTQRLKERVKARRDARTKK